MQRLRPVHHAALAVLALAGALAILVPTLRHGSGLTPDSASYIAAARNLAHGRGATLYDGRPMTLWPPLFPAVMAAMSTVTRLDPVRLAPFLCAALFGFTVYATGLLFTRVFGPTLGAASLGAVAALTSKPLLSQFLQVESDTLFLPLALVCLVALMDHLDRGDPRDVRDAAIAAAAAALARYTGVALVAIGTLAVACGPSPRRAWLALRFAGMSLLPLSLWALRNERIAGTPFGPRAPAEGDVFANMGAAVTIVGARFAPLRLLDSTAGRAFVALALVALALAGATYVARRAGRPGAALLLVGFTVGYAAFVVLMSSVIAVDRLNPRLLLPVFPPVTALVIAGVLAVGGARATSVASSRPAWLGAAVVVAWLGWSALQGAGVLTDYDRAGGWGYSSTRWETSATMQRLRADPALGHDYVYSNAPGAVYLLADRDAADSPEKHMYNSTQPLLPPSRLAGHWPPREPAVLAWFDGVVEPSMYGVDEVAAFARLDTIGRLADGTLYRVRRLAAAPGAGS